MDTLNRLVSDYTALLQQGKVQAAYRGILECIGRLRADCIKKFPQYEVGGIYPGYMDMSYFSLTSAFLKEKGLKFAIVYLHEKGVFEVWLSARNREIAKRYGVVVKSILSDTVAVFHDDTNQDAIIEYTLNSSPDFENPLSLFDTIAQGFALFETAITGLL